MGKEWTNIEVWRPVKGYEGLYEVSNWGRVKSLNYHRTGKEEILKPPTNSTGYWQVDLYKNGKGKRKLVHRLVADAFLEPVEGKDCVDHIDGNPQNNRVENLRWCTQKENNGFSLARKNKSNGQKLRYTNPEEREKVLKALNRPEVKEKRLKSLTNRKDLSKAVLQFTKDGVLVAEYPSIREAERQRGYGRGNISQCCRGRQKSAYGCVWRYKEDISETPTSTKLPVCKQMELPFDDVA